MTYEEEPNIFSETDITPEEYVQDAIKQERLAFAEKLRLLREKIREHSYEDGLLTVIELEIDDMIKELRSIDGKQEKDG